MPPKLAIAVTCVLVGGLSACTLVPGTEGDFPTFSHSFRVIDVDGEPVGAVDYGYRSASTDLGGTSVTGSSYGAGELIPLEAIESLNTEFSTRSMENGDPFCLQREMTVHRIDGGELVESFPQGTCFEDGGKTLIVDE